MEDELLRVVVALGRDGHASSDWMDTVAGVLPGAATVQNGVSLERRAQSRFEFQTGKSEGPAIVVLMACLL